LLHSVHAIQESRSDALHSESGWTWTAGHKIAMVDKGFHFPLTLTAAEQFASALAGALVQLWWHVWMLMQLHIISTASSESWAEQTPMYVIGATGWLLSKAGVLPLGPRPRAAVFMTRVLPSVLSFAGTLYLGNFAYLSLSMAFIQMLKAMVPAITLVRFWTGRMIIATNECCHIKCVSLCIGHLTA